MDEAAGETLEQAGARPRGVRRLVGSSAKLRQIFVNNRLFASGLEGSPLLPGTQVTEEIPLGVPVSLFSCLPLLQLKSSLT